VHELIIQSEAGIQVLDVLSHDDLGVRHWEEDHGHQYEHSGLAVTYTYIYPKVSLQSPFTEACIITVLSN
jgi:hypothetical protein